MNHWDWMNEHMGAWGAGHGWGMALFWLVIVAVLIAIGYALGRAGGSGGGGK